VRSGDRAEDPDGQGEREGVGERHPDDIPAGEAAGGRAEEDENEGADQLGDDSGCQARTHFPTSSRGPSHHRLQHPVSAIICK
jgi:hypothetical protein